MPLPTPNDGEGHDDWIDRCMSNDTMVEDYEDSDQRLAVCQSIWEKTRSVDMDGKPKRHIRMLPIQRAEVRVAGAESSPRIVGYAAVFYAGTPETEFKVWDDLIERIMPGAFDKTLKAKDDVRALFNHDPNMILGRTSAETLELRQDKIGLWYEIEPGDTTVAVDVLKHVKRSDITGSSFSFEVTDQTVRKVDKVDIIEIRGARLFDVGPVAFPAYEGTAAKVRAGEVAEIRSLAREWERTALPEQAALYEQLQKRALTRRVKERILPV